jgi:putative phosphoesterase
MTIAVLSDIHGNLPALRAVLADIELLEPDLVVCCGDIVSGPLPTRTLELLRELPVEFVSVRGNADRGAVESYDGTAGPETHEDDVWTGSQLQRQHRDYLAGLPQTIRMEIDGLGDVLFCHGSPRRDDEIILETMSDERLHAVLDGADADVVICGNTHMQFDRRVGGRRLVNAGSVGWPFGRPGAYWLVIDGDVEFRHTTYDADQAEEELRASGSTWPRLDKFIAHVLRDPLSQEEATASFARAADPDV